MPEDNLVICCICFLLCVTYTIGSLSIYYSQHPEAPIGCVYEGSDKLSDLDLMEWLLISGIWSIVTPTVQVMLLCLGKDCGLYAVIAIRIVSVLFSIVMFGMGMSLITEYTTDECKKTPGWDMAVAILVFYGVEIFQNVCKSNKE